MSWYIAVDGDDVGPAIRTRIIANDIEGAAALSQDLKRLFDEVSQVFTQLGAKLIFVGGDSLLVESLALPEEQWFRSLPAGPCTISVGIGRSAEVAYLALQLAKARGKDRVVVINGIQPHTMYTGNGEEA